MNDYVLQKIRLVFLFMGFLSSSIIFIFNLSHITNLSLLPLTYAVSMLIIKPCYINKNVGLALVIIEIIKIFRYIIQPIMISRESIFLGINIAPQYCEKAVWLMSYELIFVSIVMVIFCKEREKSTSTKKNNKEKISPLYFIFIIFGLYIILTEPILRAKLFNFQLSLANDIGLLQYNSDVKISGISQIFFLIGILTSFALAMKIISNIKSNLKIKLLLEITICLFLVSCLWTNGLGSVSRWNMMIGIIISIYALVFYNQTNKKKIILGGIGGIIFVIIIGSLLKTLSFGFSEYKVSDSTEMYFSSQYLDEYFEGVHSVSNCILVAERYWTNDIFSGILSDWFNTFPYLMKITGLTNLDVATTYYHVLSGHFDLIMPTITMSLLRFGWILSPIYSCIAVIFALHFDRKLYQESNLLIKLLYIYVVFWFSLFMAISPNVIGPNIWGPFIGIWLLKLEKKIQLKKIA